MGKTLTPFLTKIEQNQCPLCKSRKPGKMTDCEIHKAVFDKYQFEYMNTFFDENGCKFFRSKEKK